MLSLLEEHVCLISYWCAVLCYAVYDVTNASTLENLGGKWMRDFKEYGRPDAVQMVVGNKIDLVSQHSRQCDSRLLSHVAACGCA